ncbi:MAG: SUMF1/EgtB/PvdO family nonheme iron enzyme [Anaerolineae bacterium]|nr:SUMF1/EgtB/PvdO family nonheme iron enzyme [Anaerolineae bacterium]
MADKPHLPSELIERLNHRDCVLFVGDALDEAGSQSARLASALVDACGAYCGLCKGLAVTDGKAPRCLCPDTCEVPLTKAAQLYDGEFGRHRLLDQVQRFVEKHYPTHPVQPVYRALAELPVQVMVTTAYDDRLESALQQAGRRYNSVVRDTDLPFGDDEHVQLIRLHGTIGQRDRLVLTEDDAVDLFGRLSPVLKVILQGYFAQKTLLFVGYGLHDRHFLDLYREITGPIARYQRRAYAVQPRPDPLLVKRWQDKVELIDAAPLSFLIQLKQSIRLHVVEKEREALPPEPYKFLDYYERDDAAIFFGRDLEAELLQSTVLAHKLTVFYGRSGTGKTSLLLARVLPALEAQDYRVAYARMLGEPASEVKAAVRGLEGAGQLSYRDRGRRLVDVLAEALPPAGRLVVVLDQFEEFFVRQGEAVRTAFAREMADCLGRPSPSPPAPLPEGEGRRLDVRFVLSLRDDYLGALDEMSEVLPQDVFRHRFRLENLTREKALLAILKPAEAFGLRVEEALRERLIADLEDQGLEPANLQIVLYRLYRDAVEQGMWDERDKQGAGLTLARYGALGGTREILAGYLDEVLADLPDAAQQQAARAVLKSMVTAQQTKAAVSGQEIARGDLVARVGLGEAELDRLLAYLRGRRVVRKFGEEAAEGGRYELAHEVMVEKVWAWVSDEELRVLDIRDMLRRAMGDWGKFGHLLERGKLELVQSCCEQLALDDDEIELLFRSALAAGAEVPYWRDRAPAVVGKVEEELLAGLEAGDPKQAERAVSGWVNLASPAVVRRLTGVVEADFGNAPVIWVDHLGKRCEVRRTILNLATPRQRRAVAALGGMALPEAMEVLARWTPPGMVLVPAGPFTMGSTESSDQGSVHEVWLDAFWIDRYPVTVAQWAAFLAGGGWESRALWTEAGWQWRQREQPERGDARQHDHPMVEICWYESLACARWAGKMLLSEAQWEKAARGTDARRYPWGDEFDKKKCNTKESDSRGTTPVGKYSPQGDSPYGCADMAGNVQEWCCNLYVPYPYRAGDGREVLEGTGNRVLRGGSWFSGTVGARSAYRDVNLPYYRRTYDGVRLGWSSTSSL